MKNVLLILITLSILSTQNIQATEEKNKTVQIAEAKERSSKSPFFEEKSKSLTEEEKDYARIKETSHCDLQNVSNARKIILKYFYFKPTQERYKNIADAYFDLMKKLYFYIKDVGYKKIKIGFIHILQSACTFQKDVGKIYKDIYNSYFSDKEETLINKWYKNRLFGKKN